ncbi:MAG: DUF4397 domain-containing protein [Saprospiraceae bacterium]|nr:DUF4397 domain-containing protein [Saprospiraceae bacterium]
MFNKISKPILALASAALFFSSCQPDTEEPVVVKEYGKIQVFHAAVDARAIDFQVDGSKINADSIVYGKGTNYYEALLTTGKKTVFKVVSSKSGAVVSTDSLALNTTDVGYSVFVYQDKDAAKTVRTLYGPDNLLAPAAGKAKVRLVHLIPDVNVNIDVEAVAPGGVATINSQFPNVPFPKISDFVELTNGTYDLKFKISGQTNVLFTVPNVVVESGKIYTLVARGLANAVAPRGQAVSIITNK